jgi:ring-1,2-phenylacetyl-CoA epoxidase subunit PaaE
MRHFQPLTISDVRKETSDCVSIAFDIPEDVKANFDFIQGQYLTLRTEINGEDVRRSYSICSGRHDGELRVAIKRVEDGKFSTFATQSLKVGDVIEAMPPMGNFYVKLDAKQQRNYVAFVAGSGITPAMSLMKTTLIEEPESTFTLFYSNKTSGEIIFKTELEDLKDRFMNRLRIFHILTREPNDIELFTGRIDAEKCEGLCNNFLDVTECEAFFICGPEQMIHAVKGQLIKDGVAESKVHFELFTSPLAGALKEAVKKEVKVEDKGKAASVEIVLDGNRMVFDLAYDGENVLDAALKKGADLPFACKGGVCCTCRALLVEGEVDMDVNYSLEPDEVERGFILTCQSHPRTEKIVVDFDQQ